MLLTAIPLVLVSGTVYVDQLDYPAGVETYWSPYYQIQVTPKSFRGQRVGYEVSVNRDSHQEALNLSARRPISTYITSRQHLYNLPYTLVHPHHILVLGAGTGNDVAAGLRNTEDATVDAVEIDPVIARLGRQLHPEHPYSNPRVRLHVDDARSFLARTNQKYDLAVFGFLDSHRLFSHMSSVRMDNYVYTRENFESVRRHLTPGGITAVTFTVHEKWIADRIFTLLTRVFGHPPLVYEGDEYALGTTFLVGPRPLHIPAGASVIDRKQFNARVIRHDRQITWKYSAAHGYLAPGLLSRRATLLTDDWPYLYMQEREIPANYLTFLVLTVAVSLLLVWLLVPRIDLRQTSNWNFLFLGAAFALQETKGITDVALLFGSTWITNIIVISAILLVILLANLVVSGWRTIPLRWVYLALFTALVFNYLVPLRGLLEYGFWLQVAASGARVAGPLFFSGIIFARWFERTENVSAALGANLMGAVIGGLSEYSSLALGLNQLYLLALAFYVLSLISAYSRTPIPVPFRGPRSKLSWRSE
jgi:spermidine synthase